MHTLERILGGYAMVIALAVAVNFIITPFFFDNDSGYPIWDVLDYFMAVAILIVFVASCWDMWRLCKAGDDADLKRYVSVNVAFFATGVLLLPLLLELDRSPREASQPGGFYDLGDNRRDPAADSGRWRAQALAQVVKLIPRGLVQHLNGPAGEAISDFLA